MKRRKALFVHLSHIKRIIKKFAIIVIFIASFALILLNKTENVFLEKTSSASTGIISPVIDFVILPAKLLSMGYEKIIEMKNNLAVNEKLNKDSKELAKLKNAHIALKIENEILSNMLNYQKSPKERFITARVVAAEEDAFSHSLIVYTGSDTNVKKGQLVLSENGLVGRVEKVSPMYSKILLATDINSKIPILIQKNSARGILVGDNTNNPKIEFLPLNTQINVGDDIITSGVVGVLPSGVVVGKVLSVDKNTIKVNLTSNIETLEYVKIVDYDL